MRDDTPLQIILQFDLDTADQVEPFLIAADYAEEVGFPNLAQHLRQIIDEMLGEQEIDDDRPVTSFDGYGVGVADGASAGPSMGYGYEHDYGRRSDRGIAGQLGTGSGSGDGYGWTIELGFGFGSGDGYGWTVRPYDPALEKEDGSGSGFGYGDDIGPRSVKEPGNKYRMVPRSGAGVGYGRYGRPFRDGSGAGDDLLEDDDAKI